MWELHSDKGLINDCKLMLNVLWSENLHSRCLGMCMQCSNAWKQIGGHVSDIDHDHNTNFQQPV